MWEPTGKKATDKVTGAQLAQVRSEHGGDVAWEVTVDGVVIGRVRQYDTHLDRMSANDQYAVSRRYVRRWMFEPKQVTGERHKHAAYRFTSRGDAVWSAVHTFRTLAKNTQKEL